ncbi:hypothetical protein ACPV5U_27695 [Vibrio mediterranei]
MNNKWANLIDTKNLGWPLTPELELKKPGTFLLYLSPDIPEQVFSLDIMIEEANLSSHNRKAWAKHLRKLAETLDPERPTHSKNRHIQS